MAFPSLNQGMTFSAGIVKLLAPRRNRGHPGIVKLTGGFLNRTKPYDKKAKGIVKLLPPSRNGDHRSVSSCL
jgi:hypothetical protein